MEAYGFILRYARALMEGNCDPNTLALIPFALIPITRHCDAASPLDAICWKIRTNESRVRFISGNKSAIWSAITSAGSSLTPLSTSPTSSTSSTRLAVVSAQLPPVNEAGCFCDDIQCTIALSPPNGSRVELTHIQLTDHEMATVDDRVDS
ncbi:hypothetical protein TcWFU_006687 [Taenia crassiceps]|uniref:Uncharacterized protein n=1 Tax=Taenia crassiceps TaxID=6207 RepID=A0ABR4QE44_9CEST